MAVDHEAVRSATVDGILRCESGERVLTDLLARDTDGGPPDHRGATARCAGLALLDNVRELRASLARLDAALVATG